MMGPTILAAASAGLVPLSHLRSEGGAIRWPELWTAWGSAAPWIAIGAGLAFLAAPLFARAARGTRWSDAGDGRRGSLRRKLQARAVPAVGGVAVLFGLFGVWVALRIAGGHWDPAIATWIDPRAGAASLVLAFVAGALDDRATGGLRARTKVLLQALAATPAALSLLVHRLAEVPGEPGLAILLALALLSAAVVAQNAFNTFDNADGATTSLGVLALALHAPIFAGPLVGFLPWNLNARAKRDAGATPTAYLGDAGSHMLGMLILLVPAAWPALFLPLVDLARLSVRRLRVGSRPWIGDRRHLAHRLAHAGLGRVSVCLALLVVALPALMRPGAIGFALSGVAFLCAVAWTREPEAVR